MPAAATTEELPLPALLSAVFTAFTIEADNATEARLPHTTTAFGGEPGAPWLPSLAMWWNCVSGLAEGGEQTVAELAARTGLETNLDGMRRWGFILIDGVGRRRRQPGGAHRPTARRSSVLALTERGHAADAVWRPLIGELEARWRERHGAEAIDRLRAALAAVEQQFETALPDGMPLINLHQPARVPPAREPGAARGETLPLCALVARVLLRFELDCEQGARLPLLLCENLIRVLDPGEAVPVRELPALTGLAKEALAVLSGRLQKAEVIVEEPRPEARGKQLRLTPGRGAKLRSGIPDRTRLTTAEWRDRFGGSVIGELLGALRPVAGDGTCEGSPLFAGLEPPLDGWRAQVPPRQRLPRHPCVTHRGGYPDGS